MSPFVRRIPEFMSASAADGNMFDGIIQEAAIREESAAPPLDRTHHSDGPECSAQSGEKIGENVMISPPIMRMNQSSWNHCRGEKFPRRREGCAILNLVRTRRGLSLIELIVSIGILAILMGFFFPAVQRARESARLMQCIARQKNLTWPAP